MATSTYDRERELTAAITPAVESALPGVEDLLVEGGRVRCSVDPTGLVETLAVLGRHGLESLVSRPPSLEDLFLRLYRGEQEGGQQGEQERTPLAGAQP